MRTPAAVLEHELNARLVSSPSPLVSLLARYSKNVVFGIRCECPTREVQLHTGTQVDCIGCYFSLILTIALHVSLYWRTPTTVDTLWSAISMTQTNLLKTQ